MRIDLDYQERETLIAALKSDRHGWQNQLNIYGPGSPDLRECFELKLRMIDALLQRLNRA